MKATLSAISFAILLAGCSKQIPQPAASAETKPETKNVERGPESNTVVMAPQIQRESGVEIVRLATRAVPETVRSTARLTNDENNTWRVGSISEGRIVTVLANAGDTVKLDQVLARMHSHDIHESRALYN